MALNDLNVMNLGEARHFDDMYPSDIALSGYRAGTCTVNKGNLIVSIVNYFRSIDRESQMVPILTEHICRRCEFALRQNNNTHYLFRYVPMDYQDHGTHMTGSLDASKEELGTFCAMNEEKSVFPELPKKDCNEASLIAVPLAWCGSFKERKKD